MCRIHCLNKVLLAALRWPASPSRIPSSISSPAILQISSSLRSVLLLSSHFPLQFSKKMINDSQEQGTQSPLFPSGKEHVKHRFPSRHLGLLLEAAELTGECGSVLLHGHVSLSPSFSPVTVLLQLPRFAKTARWKEICPHTHRWSSQCGLCPPAQSGQHKRAQKAESPRLLGIKDGRWGQREEEQDGCFGGQPMHRLAYGHWGTNTLDPKWCVLPPVWWEVWVELCDPGQVLQEPEEMMEKGPCFAPSDTCSVNYFPKAILWCHASWKPTFCGQSRPQCPFLQLK